MRRSGNGLYDRGSSPGRGRLFLLWHRVQTGSEIHPTFHLRGIGGYFCGLKRRERKADHSLVPTLRISGAIPLLFQYFSMAWCLVKHRDNFALAVTVLPRFTWRHKSTLRSLNDYMMLPWGSVFTANYTVHVAKASFKGKRKFHLVLN